MFEKPRGIEQLEAAPGSAFGQNACDLIARTFGRDAVDRRRQLLHGGECCEVDCEIQARGKSHCPQEAKMILAETALGVADRADDAGGEIRAAVDVIDHLVRFGIEQQRIDGEIAAQHVLFGTGFEVHGVRAAAVAVIMVAAEGSDFDVGIAVIDEHHAENARPLARLSERAAATLPAVRKWQRRNPSARGSAADRARILPRAMRHDFPREGDG